MTFAAGEPAVEETRARATELALALPGVSAEDGYGHTGYLTRGKRFAWLLVDHHGDGRLALWVKAPPGEQESLVESDPQRYFVPAYLGPKGWVGIDLNPERTPDWRETAELIEQAWRMNATKRMLADLDASRA